MGSYETAAPVSTTPPPTGVVFGDAFTIVDALEATAMTAGAKSAEQSDAAAIQAAEVRKTGLHEVLPSGVGAEAQSAATANTRLRRDEDKIKSSEKCLL